MSVWWQALKSSRQCAAEARVGHCMMRLFIINLVCILGAWAQNLGGEALGKESKVHVHGIQLRAVVTACDKGYFESAENLVASVQLYEPGMPIFVYDLGLTANQRQIVSSWTGVSLIAIDWTTLPAHMMQLKHCAWKPAVIKDAVERVDSVLYLDAGLELRWDLEPIKADMEEIGYWLILDKQNLEKFVHPSQYDALGVERGAFRNDVGLAAGMIGFSKLSRAWTTLFLPWHNCCMNPLCISPEGSSLSNHRYDQSALSILLYKRMHEEEVYRVVVSERFWASNSTLGGIGTRLDCPTTRIKGLVFYCRRKNLPKPFSPLILYKDTVESSANLWSRIRSRFWASPYGLAYSQTLSHAEMQQALVELSFVDGAFMPQPHPSHGPDNILQNYVLKFAERLASSLSLGPRPNQIRTSARLINLIRRLTAGNGIEEKKKEMNGVGSTTDLPNRYYEVVTSTLEVEPNSVVNLIASLQTRSPAHSKISVVVAGNAIPPPLVGICNVTFLLQPDLVGIQVSHQQSHIGAKMRTNHNEVPGSLLSALLALSTALKSTKCALWLHPSLEAQASMQDLMHFVSGQISPVLFSTDEEDSAPLRCSVAGSEVPFTASKQIFAACKGTSFGKFIRNISDCWERPDCASSLIGDRLERSVCEIWQDHTSALARQQARIGSVIASRPRLFGESAARRALFVVRTGRPPYHRARICSHRARAETKKLGELGQVENNNTRPVCVIFVHLTLNLGDDIQTVAAQQAVQKFTQSPCLLFRDRLRDYQDNEPTVVLFNGWFAHLSSIPPLGEWPPPDNLLAIPVSVHLSHSLRSRLATHWADVAWFKERQPIGCRDWGTWEALTRAGIDAFFTGCLTTTFPRKGIGGDNPSHPYAVAVDFDSDGLPVKTVGDVKLQWYNMTHTLSQENMLQSPQTRLDRASLYIEHLGQANQVWTTRLHAYLPSRAMGVHVVTDFSNAADPARFRGLDNITDETMCAMRERLRSIIHAAVPVFTKVLPGDQDSNQLRRRLYKKWETIAREIYPPEAFDGSSRKTSRV